MMCRTKLYAALVLFMSLIAGCKTAIENGDTTQCPENRVVIANPYPYPVRVVWRKGIEPVIVPPNGQRYFVFEGELRAEKVMIFKHDPAKPADVSEPRKYEVKQGILGGHRIYQVR